MNGQAVLEQKMFKIVFIYMLIALRQGQKNLLSHNISTNINLESLCSFAVSFFPHLTNNYPHINACFVRQNSKNWVATFREKKVWKMIFPGQGKVREI